MSTYYDLVNIDYQLRPRQLESIPYIDGGDDFIVVLPTGYGKTIIAIMATAKVLGKSGKIVMLTPLKALTKEHTDTFAKYFSKYRIILDDGDNRKEVDEYKDWDILISTIERFSSLLNRPKRRETLFSDIRLIICDECHTIGSNRGPNLESAIIKTRILFPKCRIIGLSATIDNAKEFSRLLNCKLIHANKSERPVPLKIRITPYTDRFNTKLNMFERTGIVKKIMNVHKNKNFLIFTTSRARTKQVIEHLVGKERITLTEALYNYRMGWHNAGMRIEDKNTVERLFRIGKIKVIACTPTLAAGINLPADVVILFDSYQWSYLRGKEIIEKDRIMQTLGRAGRPGLSKIGYAYILCTRRQRDEVIEHIKKPFIIRSRLQKELNAKILEWITAGILTKWNDMAGIMKLFMDKSITSDLLELSIKWLEQNRFIKLIDNLYQATYKGRQTSYQMIQPETVLHWERILYNKENITNPELFCLIASAPEYAGIVIPRDHDTDKIAYAKQFVGLNPEITKHFVHYFGDIRVDYTDNIYKIFALTYHKELINKYRGTFKNEYEQDRFEKNFIMSYGDKYTVKGASSRYLNAASIISMIFKDELKELLIGSAHSIITGDIIELAKMKGVGDVRLQLLMNHKIDSVQKFISTSNKKLSDILKLKPETIQKLKKNSIQFV